MTHTTEWSSFTPSYLSRKYDRIAPVYFFFERIFLLPLGIRRKTVESLGLKEGDNVIEIGCGTGKNLRLLSEAVGSTGTVYGIDVSGGMLNKAAAEKERSNLSNVKLLLTDASEYAPPHRINAVLFSLSYATMIYRREVLKNFWDRLKPGGRVVIMDAQYPPGLMGIVMTPLKPLITMFLKASVLGNPHIKITNELAEITNRKIGVSLHSMKTYFIASAVK